MLVVWSPFREKLVSWFRPRVEPDRVPGRADSSRSRSAARDRGRTGFPLPLPEFLGRRGSLAPSTLLFDDALAGFPAAPSAIAGRTPTARVGVGAA